MSHDWLLTRRLNKEIRDSLENDKPGVFFAPDGGNIMKWEGCVEGPADSLYDGIKVNVTLEIPQKYPFEAPIMKAPGLFHPNVYPGAGQVCMSILHDGDDVTGYEKRCERWTPQKGISQVFLSFQQLLGEPNPDSPANPTACRMYLANREKFKQRIQDDYLKKTQQEEFNKCSKMDEIKSRKRKMLLAKNKPKKPLSEEERANFLSLLPKEPEKNTGGILLKFRTPSKMYARYFCKTNLAISAFDFLSSNGIVAISMTPCSLEKFDRQKAENTSFNDLNILEDMILNVEILDDEDDSD